MLFVAMFAAAQIASQAAPLTEEGVWLGRLSTAVAICRESGYGVDETAAREVVDGFEARATLEGWTSENFQAAYDQGRELERADIKILFDFTGLTRSEIRRAYRHHLHQTKVRCRVHSERFPTVISNVRDGERAIDANLSAVR